MSRIQAEITTIPYNGTAPAMTALMGGQIDIMCDQTTQTTAQIKSGRVKVYGTTTKKRVPALPFVPTLQEQGLKDFEDAVWHGVYAPKGTPENVTKRLTAALQRSIADQTFKTRMPVSKEKATPAGLQTHLKAEIEKWAPVIKAAGVYAD